MFARELRPEEYWRARLAAAVAFEGAFDFEKEQEKAATDRPDPLAAQLGAFMQEGEPPVATLVVNRKQVRFDGQVLGLGGVGGVATLPAHRRGGAIRACMAVALRKMADEGMALSHLYPFSTAYYRQFGFAACGQTLRWRLRLAPLRRLGEEGGSVRQLLPGDDLSPLLKIYDRAFENTNLSALRSVYDARLEGGAPLAQRRNIFVWYDSEGRPGSFLVGTRAGQTLDCCTDFAANNGLLFADAAALRGLLGFVATAFAANFEDIRFAVPAHTDLTALLPELSGSGCEAVHNGMVRAVSAEKLLAACRCHGEGVLRLRVKDDILPENDAVFALDFAPGRANRVRRTDDAPDVVLDAGSLAALLCGLHGAEGLAFCPDVEVLSNEAAIRRVFYRKPCHMLDLY